jgi:ankyrin repeat protein
VKPLLEKAIDVDTRDTYDRTPLSYAAESGHEVVVKLQLEKAFDVDPRDTYDRTPLSYAAENGHKAVVKQLESKTQSQ